MTDLYPLKLEPRPSERLWGGRRLRHFIPGFASLETKEPIGEAWLIYGENKILNGALAGKTLQEVASSHGEALLGSKSVARYGDKVPLLSKFIDAADNLSIQVHPDDSYALRNELASGHLGKTEAWYILEAEPSASIIWGFSQEVSKEQLRKAIAEGELEPYLNIVPVKTEDVIYNAAGKVHAIGAGIFLFEIQQSSDLTYRLYDYNRKDASGQLRELHIEKSLEVADFGTGKDAKMRSKRISDIVTQLLVSEYFVAERWDIHGRVKSSTSPESLELLTVLNGHIQLLAGDELLDLAQADSLVLPASLGDFRLEGQGQLIRCYVP